MRLLPRLRSHVLKLKRRSYHRFGVGFMPNSPCMNPGREYCDRPRYPNDFLPLGLPVTVGLVAPLSRPRDCATASNPAIRVINSARRISGLDTESSANCCKVYSCPSSLMAMQCSRMARLLRIRLRRLFNVSSPIYFPLRLLTDPNRIAPCSKRRI